MKKINLNKKLRRIKNTGLFLLLLFLLFAVSTVAGFFYFKNKFAFDSSFIADIEARHEKKVSEGPKKDPGRLYEGGRQEDIQANTVFRQDAQLVRAEDIIKKYVAPYKVRLLDLYLDNEGVIYIDLGDEIKRNFNGGALEELKLIAGLYSSIKPVVPGFSALKILIEGSEAESFGGHVDISKPIGEEIAESI